MRRYGKRCSPGCQIGFGTDLLGPHHDRQGIEFGIRREVFSAEILRQVTFVNAALLRAESELGCVKAGARADLLLVRGNPLENLDLLAANGANFAMVMHGGVPKHLTT